MNDTPECDVPAAAAILEADDLKKQLEDALSAFALTYLRLGDLMTHTQTLLRSGRAMGKSGQQVAVLKDALTAVEKSYNYSVPAFTDGALSGQRKAAVARLVEEIKQKAAVKPTSDIAPVAPTS
jgi:hypothetical protein